MRKILVEGFCEDKSAIIFTDTGSTITLVSPSFIDRLDKFNEVQDDDTILTSFSNNQVHSKGSIYLNIYIADTLVSHKFVISDLVQHDFLLGMDVMSRFSLNLDIENRVMFSPFGCTNFIKAPVSVSRIHKISCKGTTVVHPNTIHTLKMRIQSRSNSGRVEGIFVPYDNFMATSGIIMKPSWCYANNGLLHLPCVNTTNDPVTIYRNKIIGSFEPVKSAEFGHVSVCKLDKANHDHKEGQINSGWKDINILYDKLKIDSLPLSGSEKDQLKKVISKYSDCFATHPYDLGKCTMYKAHIEMEKDARPVWVPSRAVPYNMQKFMDKEIKSMKDSGMIEDCKFSLWNSQTFLVPKKNNKFRVVQDCRNINKASMPDKFELPNLNHLLDGLKETTYLSTFDFVSSFSQIPLSKSSRPYFAFNYNGSRYQFKRLVQGHKTSSSQFSRMMQRLLGKANISNLLWFVDDLVLGSNSVLDHIKRMELLFQRLRFANLKLSPDKSEIFQSSIKFVGMTVSNKGIAIDKDRVKAIVNLKSPTTVKDLQKVLGIFQYSRKYIRNFASISQPLYALLQRNTKFVWSNECEEAMKTLKNAITQAPVLGIANPNGQFEVTCDASAKGFGGMLQERLPNGSLKTIAYFSKSVPKHQRHWHATKLEFLAMHACLMHWRIYLQGAKRFKVFTDCKPLLSFHKLYSKGNAAMQRKLADLAGMDMEICHISGESNVVSDALSRLNHGPDTVNKFTQTDNLEKTVVNKIVQTSTRSSDHTPSDLFSQLDKALIAHEQKQDVLLSELRQWIEKGNKPLTIQEINSPNALLYYWKNFDKFFLKNDLIYFKWPKKASKTEISPVVRDLIVVPQTLIERVIKLYHGGIQSCHTGIATSLDLCRHKFWFFDQRQEFEHYINSCPKCHEIKQPRKFMKAPMRPVIFRDFNQGVAIDHIVVSQDQVTARGNRYILTITCLFTGYLVACPVKTQNTNETIRMFLQHWATIFGWPLAIIHDNHKGFTSDLFSAMTTIFDIDDRHTTPYNCQSNGKVESQNKRINNALRASLSESQIKNWDVWLKYVVFTLNSLKSSRTSYSSNFLVFGRHLRAPRDLWLEQANLDHKPDPYENIDNLRKKAAYDLHKQIGDIMQKVQKSTKRSVDNMAKRYNLNASESNFNEGQYCYVKINVPSSKFSARWTGPWKIVKKINENLYIVLVNNKETVINVSKMKPYRHSKYFPENQEKGTQVDHKESKSRPINETYDDFAVIYRPITPSNTFDETSRAQLQHEINNPTGTGSNDIPTPGTENVQPGTNVTNSPSSGINDQAAGSNEPSYYERMANASPIRAASTRTRRQTERLTYPYDHVEVNKRYRKKN